MRTPLDYATRRFQRLLKLWMIEAPAYYTAWEKARARRVLNRSYYFHARCGRERTINRAIRLMRFSRRQA